MRHILRVFNPDSATGHTRASYSGIGPCFSINGIFYRLIGETGNRLCFLPFPWTWPFGHRLLDDWCQSTILQYSTLWRFPFYAQFQVQSVWPCLNLFAWCRRRSYFFQKASEGLTSIAFVGKDLLHGLLGIRPPWIFISLFFIRVPFSIDRSRLAHWDAYNIPDLTPLD